MTGWNGDGRRGGATLVLCGLLGWLATRADAQTEIPSLPFGAHDYVGYAVDDLPGHMQAPLVQATNNTPASNPLTNAGATLGRVLFYDRQLSHDHSVACASCHQQATGFGDTDPLSQGVNGLTGRHSMSLSNVGYYERGRAFWDERAASLEEQALLPIQDPVEMNLDLPTLVTRLEGTPFYAQLFEAAFGTPEVTPARIGQAIAQFERSMVSYQAPIDQVFTGAEPNLAVLTPRERQGFAIFHGPQAQCSNCHTTSAFVSDAPHNIGLDSVDTDEGAGNGRFKAPSLRNAEVRGHFMHDGRFSSLEEVIDFYSEGVNEDNPNIAPNMANRNFTQQEKDALLAFLRLLTDNQFLTDEKFSNPFVLACDFDGDGQCGIDDLNTLLAAGPIAGGVAIGSDNQRYDINFDGVLNGNDLEMWLTEAALVDGLASPYQVGDANLDSQVDGQDFIIWNSSKFTAQTAWDRGDFNGDGLVDGQDFVLWNGSKFTASDGNVVPEPDVSLSGWGGLLWLVVNRLRRRHR
ncbi:MAG: cytochrome c peroxidase [Planctomycetota bacterium]